MFYYILLRFAVSEDAIRYAMDRARKFFSLSIVAFVICVCLYLIAINHISKSGHPSIGELGKVGYSVSDIRRESDKQGQCVPERYRDISESFQERSSTREALMRCAEADFFDVIRKQGGADPKLLSEKTESTKEKIYGERNEYVVPNVVHYILFSRPMKFKFLTYLSYRSAHKFIKPNYILLHGDVLPTGYWWNRTLADVPNIYHLYVKGTTSIYGQKFAYPTQHSNLLRLYIMLGK